MLTTSQGMIISLLCIILAISLILLFFVVKTFKQMKETEQINEKSPTAIECDNKTKVSFLKDEIITTVLLKMFSIRNSIHKQTTNIHTKSIENAPKKIGISYQLLAQCFTKSKIEKIDHYWNLFNDYVNNYWVNKNGKIKTVFSGDINKRTGEVGQMIIASEQVIIILDQILEEIQKEDE